MQILRVRMPRAAHRVARMGGPEALVGYCAEDGAVPSTTACATSRIVRRRSIDVFWIQRNAAGSVMPSCA